MDLTDVLTWFAGGFAATVAFWLPSFLLAMGKKVLDAAIYE